MAAERLVLLLFCANLPLFMGEPREFTTNELFEMIDNQSKIIENLSRENKELKKVTNFQSSQKWVAKKKFDIDNSGYGGSQCKGQRNNGGAH